MPIKEGDMLPKAQFVTMTADGPQPVDFDGFFKGRKIALFSVPGAYTPTCSARHLPGFVDKADELKAKGIDEIAVTAVNDVFVLGKWTEEAGDVTALADGNGEFVKSIDLAMDGTGYGMGTRGQRFSMIVDDGKVVSLNVEQPGDFRVSSAEHMLEQL